MPYYPDRTTTATTWLILDPQELVKEVKEALNGGAPDRFLSGEWVMNLIHRHMLQVGATYSDSFFTYNEDSPERSKYLRERLLYTLGREIGDKVLSSSEITIREITFRDRDGFPYHFGTNPKTTTIKNGEVVSE